MQNYIIKATNLTPSITLKANTGIIEIKGKSIPENSLEFEPVYEWLDAYILELSEKTVALH